MERSYHARTIPFEPLKAFSVIAPTDRISHPSLNIADSRIIIILSNVITNNCYHLRKIIYRRTEQFNIFHYHLSYFAATRTTVIKLFFLRLIDKTCASVDDKNEQACNDNEGVNNRGKL